MKLPEILLGGSFNGVKLQSETFHEPGESPDQPLAVFSAGQSNTWKHRSALRRAERFEHMTCDACLGPGDALGNG